MPIAHFGRTIINEHYSENLPSPAEGRSSTVDLAEMSSRLAAATSEARLIVSTRMVTSDSLRSWQNDF